MVEIIDLHKKYGKFKALDGMSLTINDGDVFGFVGPNGAGKTTTMKILAGLLQANSGRVLIDGVDVLGYQNEIKSYFGYMPDFFGVYDNLKAIDYMEFYAGTYGIYGNDAIKLGKELMALVNLSDKVDSFVDGLSRGMKQRLCLARCLIHNPSLLILDEPASGLDPRTRIELKEILKNLSQMGKTILISSHILTELSEMCNSIGIIEGGKTIVSGSIDKILSEINMTNPIVIGIVGDTEKAVRMLKENPEVKSVKCVDNKIQISFDGGELKECELLKQLMVNDIMVNSFIREKCNLESVFMKITDKGGQQDEA